MKILAFSDWRDQPFSLIIEAIKRHKPHAILYAGDGINRFVKPASHILIQVRKSQEIVKYRTLGQKGRSQSVISRGDAKRLRETLSSAFRESMEFFEKVQVPIYFVNGNHDLVGHGNGGTLVQCNPFFDSGLSEIGCFVPFTFTFGKEIIGDDRSKVSIFGSECTTDGEVKTIPKMCADIILSHVPPIGELDLSSVGRIAHIGSRRLLQAIRKTKPKLVVCGHSHYWGGSIDKVGRTKIVNVSSDRDPLGEITR